jgi:hypothetical protein
MEYRFWLIARLYCSGASLPPPDTLLGGAARDTIREVTVTYRYEKT